MSLPWTSYLAAHLATVVGALLLIPFLARILRDRRPPGSTIAWLLGVLLVPYVGVPLYLLLGPRKLRVPADRLNSRGVGSASPSESPPVARLLSREGAPDPTDGNHVELLTSGEAAFSRLVELIDGATRSIELATFILARDATGQRVLEALTARAAAGVEVRVLIDGLFAPRASHRLLAALRRAGGQVRVFSPLFHLGRLSTENLRNHRKITVIDGEHAWVGGMNVAEEYMGPTPQPGRWRDLAAHVRGPAVSVIADIVRRDWARAAGESAPPPTARAEARGSAVAQVVPSGPDAIDDGLYDALLTACYAAVERIWVATPYFVPDDALARALTGAARRGVDVLVVVPRRSNHYIADLAGGSYLRPIQRAGGRVATYPSMLHAKVVVIDDAIGMIGSANFDMRSLLLNYEIALFFYSMNEVKNLAAWFEETLATCGELSPPTRLRSLGEDLGRLLAPIS